MIKIELSVHDLVDFILRTGNIDSRVFNVETMNEGSRLHKIYQDKQKNYQSEVYFKHEFINHDFLYVLNGRADGLFSDEEGNPVIDEIKTANTNLKKFHKENKKRHLGQAEVYALIYCIKNDVDNIKIKLTYISQIDNSILEYYYKYTKKQLEKKISSYLDKYSSFLIIQQDFNKLKKKSLKKLDFPFKKTRKGQKEMVDLTYLALKNKENYFFNASTGIGKTMSLLYGSLKGINDELNDKTFYLTAKNSGFNSIIDALNILYDKKLRLKSIVITAKDKICINKDNKKACNPDECPFAKEYYSKLFDIINYSLLNYDFFTKETILKIAKDYQVCPFELSLDLSLKCDFIICDYNYVYDPSAYLKRYFDDSNSKNNLILVDEAHNLVDRSRAMYSASISKIDILKAIKELNKVKRNKLKNTLIKIIEKLDEYSNDLEDNEVKTLSLLPDELLRLIERFKNSYLEFKKNNLADKTIEIDNLSLSFFRFLTVYDLYNDIDFRINVKKTNDIVLAINCLDASQFISFISKNQRSSIFFSATMKPINYYKKLILNDEDISDFNFESPFNKDNLKVLVNDKISLKYKDRNLTISNVVFEINEFIKNKIGNYIVFLPSFEYLTKVKEIVENSNVYSFYEMIFQRKDMNSEEKEQFLDDFKVEPSKTHLAFCVLGGSFSEGVDLISTRLIGTIIVGVGIPSICYENKQLAAYFDEKEINGFEYVYTYPGINKILQAVGRIIRSENDKGMTLLIDKRYSQRNYKFLFSEIFKNYLFIKDEDDIAKEVEKFYK